MENPDYKIYSNMYNVLTMKGQHSPLAFGMLIDPFDKEEVIEEAEENFKKIKIPIYTGAGWYAYTYKMHLRGAPDAGTAPSRPHKKLLFTPPAHPERPFHALHDEILRWYDHWLKGIDNGIMAEPPVKYWVMGENTWRTEKTGPCLRRSGPRTICAVGRGLVWSPSPESATTTSTRRVRPDAAHPDQQDPEASLHDRSVPEDLLIAGPTALNLFASIDQDDTNWIVTLKDVGPDVSVRPRGRASVTSRTACPNGS